MTGGADAGLAVTSLRADDARGLRVAELGPAPAGVRFYVIPTGAAVVAAATVAPVQTKGE